MIVVEDYNTLATGADQFKGTLLLKSSSTGAPLDKNFLAMQRHHENTTGNSYQNTLPINTFRITNDVSKLLQKVREIQQHRVGIEKHLSILIIQLLVS
ncbi:hypothetical protein [Brevinema andersonii]|uniref:hypothetical protein n=1 Tax=Brevinema andersonii TaxID=34097 RepID=UPI000B80E1C0|nr:hypothetical protein [Brevinema andersonii]